MGNTYNAFFLYFGIHTKWTLHQMELAIPFGVV